MVPLNKLAFPGIGTNHFVFSESDCPASGGRLHTITNIKSIKGTAKSTVSPTKHPLLPDLNS